MNKMSLKIMRCLLKKEENELYQKHDFMPCIFI